MINKPPHTPMIIAEIGVNHNGSPDKALQLVDAAIAAGADAVKTQTFHTNQLVSRQAPKAGYQLRTTDPGESQRQMLRRLELDATVHLQMQAICQEANVAYISSPFDLESLAFLVTEMNLEILKIPSGEITNAPLLLEAGRSEKRILLSTGMATLDEVAQALGVLAFGLILDNREPSLAAFAAAFRSEAGQWALKQQVTLLHCVTAYPTPPHAANLRAMDALSAAFSLPVGWSDHTSGTAIAIAAVARGAVVVEKHLTLDRTLAGPDHQVSLEPAEFSQMVQSIREVSMALGEGGKIPAPEEMGNMAIVRKSLHAIAAIAAGEPFTEANLGSLRPGDGISPFHYWEYLGQPAKHSLETGERIR